MFDMTFYNIAAAYIMGIIVTYAYRRYMYTYHPETFLLANTSLAVNKRRARKYRENHLRASCYWLPILIYSSASMRRRLLEHRGAMTDNKHAVAFRDNEIAENMYRRENSKCRD